MPGSQSTGNVVTVTLNPAVDQTLIVDDFRPNTVNRARSATVHAGGKGINVAAFLADYGQEVCATGFLGEENAALFERLFASKGIVDRFVHTPGNTRFGVKIVDEVREETTDLNLPGLPPTSGAVEKLFATLDDLADTYTWFVLTGSLPPGLPPDFYVTLIRRLKARGRHVVLDTSGEALREGAAAGPQILKPNATEISQLLGRPLSDTVALVTGAQRLLARGTELVAVTLGAKGAILVTAEESVIARPPKVKVASTVGAGDAFVAGLVAAQLAHMDPLESARLATAFAAGATTRLGSHLPPLRQLERYREQSVVVRWSR
ncbi:MAG: 1-phosphofructokinase [Anaerolineales bacterium]